MSEQPDAAPTATEPASMPETTALLLTTFADLYRQEVGAEEDVHRTLPFFGTALGIVIGAVAYAAGRLPRWSDLTTDRALVAFIIATTLLGLAIIEAGGVLVWVSRAIARRDCQRVGPEPALRARLAELQAYYDGQGIAGDQQDKKLAVDMQQTLLDSYAAATPANRNLNQRRYKFRARASSHLVRSLIWALGATSVIFLTDKLAVAAIGVARRNCLRGEPKRNAVFALGETASAFWAEGGCAARGQ